MCVQVTRGIPPNDDVRELVVSLLTRVGVIMEDASPIAILAASRGVELAKTIDQLDEASDAIGVLIKAAKVLERE